MRLGEILIHRKVISKPQLEHVLTRQSVTSQPLGELLLEYGMLAKPQLSRALKEQYWRRRGFWIID